MWCVVRSSDFEWQGSTIWQVFCRLKKLVEDLRRTTQGRSRARMSTNIWSRGSWKYLLLWAKTLHWLVEHTWSLQNLFRLPLAVSGSMPGITTDHDVAPFCSSMRLRTSETQRPVLNATLTVCTASTNKSWTDREQERAADVNVPVHNPTTRVSVAVGKLRPASE